MTKRFWRGMRIWLKEMSLLTRAGLIVVVVGGVIDIFYHGVLATWHLVPHVQSDMVQLAGHWITLAGMLIMFAGVLREAYIVPRKNRPPVPNRVVVNDLNDLRRH